MIHIKRSISQMELNLKAVTMGSDLCLIFTGGSAHLGAVTAGSGNIQFQTIPFGSHKEHFVTEKVAEILKERFKGSYVICCGIHFDNITKERIQDVLSLCCDMTKEVLEELEHWK